MTTQHVASKDGTKIAYEVVGQGPPLVYVMGATGTRKISFMTAIRDELAKSYTVYFYDRRGRGETGDVSPTKYVVEREIEDLRAMCEVASADARAAGASDAAAAPFVCASSSGAALALLAASAGVPMRALAAHEPPYAVGAEGASFDRDYQRNVTRLVAEGKDEEALKYFMRIVGVPAPMVWAMRFMPFWKDGVAAAPSLPYDAAVMGRFDLPEKQLRAIAVPTYVLVGTKTAPILKAAADAVARTVPNARKVEMPKQNHGVKPAALRQALVENLR